MRGNASGWSGAERDPLDYVDPLIRRLLVSYRARHPLPPPPDGLRTPAKAARKPRKSPTLASVAKQASKAAIAVARYEVKPDGTVVIITGKPEPVEPENPWPLDGRRLREMHKQALGGLLVLAEVPNAPEERQARREASFRP